MKRQHLLAVARGALGEHRQPLTGTQTLGHVVHHAQGIAPVVALNKQGARSLDQTAHHRPLLHIRLRHKAAGASRIHHDDVEPRHVVGHHQQGASRLLAQHLQPHTHHLQRLRRPLLHQQPLAGSIFTLKSSTQNPQTLQQVKHQAQHAPSPSHGIDTGDMGHHANRISRTSCAQTPPAHPPRWPVPIPAFRGLQTGCARCGCAGLCLARASAPVG